MQIVRKVGLIQELILHLKGQIWVAMNPLVQVQQLGLQKLHPSTKGFGCKYHQKLGRK